MKKLLVSLLALVLVLSIGAEAKAQEAKKGSPDLMTIFRPPNDKEVNAIVTQLQLTEEQHSQLQNVNARYKSEIQQLMNKYQNARDDLKAAFQGNPDPDRVESEIKTLNQIHSSVVDKEAELWTSISDILTEQQATKFWKLFGKNRLRVQ